MNRFGQLFVVVAAATAASASHAQMQVVGRASGLSYDYLYGFAGDIRTGNDSRGDLSLLLSDTEGLAGSSTGDGYYPPSDHHWSATVTWDMAHTYAIAGGLGAASSITSSGLTTLTSLTTGATSGVNSLNPGNLLTIDFNILVGQDLHFFGALEQSGPGNRNGSLVTIYRDNGAGGWSTFYITTLANAPFDAVRYFEPGAYRIEAGAGCMAGGNETTHAAWTYTLEVVPAPSAAMLLALGCAGPLIRRRPRGPAATHRA